MRCRFAPVACAVILALVTPQRGDGADIPEHLASVTLESQKEWAAARGCSVTADASKTLISKMSAFGETIERRTLKLTWEEAAPIIKGVTHVYLDKASIQGFGRDRKNCVVDEQLLKKVSFPQSAGNPSTGILEVNGSQGGADIWIDDEKKGSISQAFILSVGRNHKWKTMRCEEDVRIIADEFKKVYCDKK